MYTIEDCKRDTRKHIDTVQSYMNVVINGLSKRADAHDKSKLETPEVEMFTEYTPKLKNSTYGSDEYKGFLQGMGVALKHHYEHNSHHPEHNTYGIKGMNLLDIVEMFCDWKAATLRHADGDIRKSIEFNQSRFGYSDDLKAIFQNTADLFDGPLPPKKYCVEWGCVDNREGKYEANTVEELHRLIDADQITSELEKTDLKYGFFREFRESPYENKDITWDNAFGITWTVNAT